MSEGASGDRPRTRRRTRSGRDGASRPGREVPPRPSAPPAVPTVPGAAGDEVVEIADVGVTAPAPTRTSPRVRRPTRRPDRGAREEAAGVNALVTTGPSHVTVVAAMRARDVSRRGAADPPA